MCIRDSYRYLVHQRLVESSPIKGLKIPKLPKRLAQYLTVEQMESLLAAPSGLLLRDRKASVSYTHLDVYKRQL